MMVWPNLFGPGNLADFPIRIVQGRITLLLKLDACSEDRLFEQYLDC